MRRFVVALAAASALVWVGAASAGWNTTVPLTNQDATTPAKGGGYPVAPGATAPEPGTCRLGNYNSNRSESWVAVKPGTEDLVGVSKFFFETFSTFYDFHLGSYTMPAATPGVNVQIPGYDCVSTGVQDMPPSWTNNTDPNVDFDTQGRAYQVTLPFNAFWEGGLHPNGAIDLSYSDDLGLHWIKGNGGEDLENNNNQTSLAFGHVEDKQWVAVNHIPGNQFRDHVYAMWTTFNGAAGNGKIRLAVSRDRGQTFSKAVTITPPGITTPATTYVYPSVGSDGTLYVAFVGGFDTTNKNRVGHVYVTKSTDDGETFGPFVAAATPGENPNGFLPNTNFRDGIIENFAASPTYAGHVYLTYEDWDFGAGQFDVKFRQSTDGGLTWSDEETVNDAPNSGSTDQFQPSVAAGPGGAVAVAFYDRRADCPNDPSILPDHVGDANTCIDISLQPYKDAGTSAGAAPGGGNVRVSEFTWDPDQSQQKVGGITQYACAGHDDPCPTGRGFIGDYFGLAISGFNVYTFGVSTHYPSTTVTADGGGPVYYQNQVLGIVPRSTFGGGY
ncbi:MAG: sialidase family protein [Solirubrobacteraceae bacterium]